MGQVVGADAARPSRWAVDAAVGLGLCAVTAARLLLGEPIGSLSWAGGAAAGLAGCALALRYRWPLPALALALASGISAVPDNLAGSPVNLLLGAGLLASAAASLARTGHPDRAAALARLLRPGWRVPAGLAAAVAAIVIVPVDLKEAAGVAILLCAYAAGLTSARTVLLVAAVAGASGLVLGATLASADSWTGPDTPVPLVATLLVGAAVGDAVRSRRELLVASEERARRSEQVLAEESRRRLVQERLRIAREVHDLVAHHIAVVSMQAGVAAHHLRGRDDLPEAAVAAIGHVRTASRTVLGELGTLLSVLRDPDDPAAPVAPMPRLADLDELLGSLRAAGLRVDRTVTGAPRALPPSADLAAYRTIQECLTNARKYGDGTAQVSLSYTADWLEIEVRNRRRSPGQTAAGAGTGHGLAGTRERLAAAGGTFAAGPAPDSQFVATARLPTLREDRR